MTQNRISDENQARIAEYQLEGLLPDGFEPLGETEHAVRKSIEARAYTTWVQENGHLAGCRHSEEVRTIFAHRRDVNFTVPPEDVLEFSLPQEPMAEGFHRMRDLPAGDAYEGPDVEVPPPMEG